MRTSDWRVEETQDKGRIRRFLAGDRLWTAYALGDLEPGMFEQCDWVAVTDGARDVALVLLFKGLDTPGLWPFGDDDGVRLALAEAVAPVAPRVSIRPAQRAVVEAVYALDTLDLMTRMVVDAASFSPVAWSPLVPPPRLREEPEGSEGGAEGLPPPRRLTGGDASALNALYASGETPDAFAPSQDRPGRVLRHCVSGYPVAAAGTHLLAPSEGVAAVGNVFTYRAWRGRGLPVVRTSAVVASVAARRGGHRAQRQER
ncbi:MAG: hypothetical protein KIS91_04665 [Anaerolineae bacterium]|nr:hypothetical protein [Anaerolineae bacterium]